jgi:deoxyribonucleoside regulator
MSTTDATPTAHRALMAHVARRYYLRGATKREIGEELGVSRFRVARLLEQALAEGVVRIDIDDPLPLADEAAADVRDRYGLAGAWWWPIAARSRRPPRRGLAAGAPASRRDGRRRLGLDDRGRDRGPAVRPAARRGRRPGLWRAAGRRGRRSCGDCLAAGRAPRRSRHRAARARRARARHAGGLAGQPGTRACARALRADLDRARGRGRPRHRAALGRRPGVARCRGRPVGRARRRRDLLVHLFTAEGTILDTGLEDRVIALPLEALRRARVIAVAGGTAKVEAVTAALRTGLVDVLVTDEACARAALAAA